jgi:serine/threonine protein kinase/tetratricopeptide (TPR) repeat protein
MAKWQTGRASLPRARRQCYNPRRFPPPFLHVEDRMTFEQWQQANQLLQTALAQPPAERAAFVQAACGADEELRHTVERLLRVHPAEQSSTTLADETLGESAAEVTSALIVPLPSNQPASPLPKLPVMPVTDSDPTTPALTPPATGGDQQFGAYQVLHELGRGSMGQVYAALDTRLGRKVALKLLPATMHTDATRVRRFEQEARAASALNHPNIVTIFEVGEAPAGRFIVMELIEGRTLRSLLNGSYTLAELLSWGAQLAKALSAAHKASIVHRDIKPENIMVRADGYVKVLDFGLARLSDTNATNLDQFGTTPGALIGTIRYMSPEQVRGDKAEAPSDIFALGVILYELITRKHPFPGTTIYEIMQAITTFTPKPPAHYASDLPAEVNEIIRLMLDKNVRRRPNAQEVAATLNAGSSSASGSSSQRALVEPVRELPISDDWQVEEPGQPPPPSYTTRFDEPSPYDTLVEASVPAAGRSSGSQASGSQASGSQASGSQALGNRSSDSQSSGGRSSGSGIQTLAVLPFVQAGQNEEVEFLCDGIAESLINNLAALPNLRVLARSTVFRFKSPHLDPLAAGRELGVQSVLTGRVVQHGGKVIVKVELVNVNEGTQVWGENYLRQLTDIFALEAEIAQAISAQLRLKLSGAQQERLAKLHTENAEAYQAYLRGRHCWNRRTEDGLKSAIEAFNQAITLDPSYALAYSGLADTYLVLGTNGLWHPADTLPKAKAYVTAALELDPALAPAHATMGSLHACYEFNWMAAERSLKQAIELNPGYATAHFWHAVFFLLCWGRFDETLAAIDRALKLDPLSLIINTTRGYALLLARRYDEAAAQLRKAHELEPAFFGSLEYLALLHEQTGQYEAALSVHQHLLTDFYQEPASAQALRAAYEHGGGPAYWRKRLEIVQARAQTRYIYPHRFAELHTRLGEYDQALHWLEKACDDRSARIIWIGVNPLFDALRSEPRFQALLQRMKLR